MALLFQLDRTGSPLRVMTILRKTIRKVGERHPVGVLRLRGVVCVWMSALALVAC